MKPTTSPFWKIKKLSDMTHEEWESLCDNCAQCCLVKLEDEDTGEVYQTNVVCRLLDIDQCRCTAYEKRSIHVPSCVKITPTNITDFWWLTETCAYKRIAEGKELEHWHHLNSGDMQTVHLEGISVKDKVVSENHVHPDELEDYIVEWDDGQKKP